MAPGRRPPPSRSALQLASRSAVKELMRGRGQMIAYYNPARPAAISHHRAQLGEAMPGGRGAGVWPGPRRLAHAAQPASHVRDAPGQRGHHDPDRRPAHGQHAGGHVEHLRAPRSQGRGTGARGHRGLCNWRCGLRAANSLSSQHPSQTWRGCGRSLLVLDVHRRRIQPHQLLRREHAARLHVVLEE